MQQTYQRRRSLTSPSSSRTTAAAPSQRRRGSQQKQQKQQQDSLSSIDESDRPTLELAAYASDEFVHAMREAAAARNFSVVPSRQAAPHLRRMSEPASNFLLSGRRGSRRHSVDAIVEGDPISFLSKKSQFGSNEDSTQLSSFVELDEADYQQDDDIDSEVAQMERANSAMETARTLLRWPTPEPSEASAGPSGKSTGRGDTSRGRRSVLSSVQSQRRVSIDSAVYVH